MLARAEQRRVHGRGMRLAANHLFGEHSFQFSLWGSICYSLCAIYMYFIAPTLQDIMGVWRVGRACDADIWTLKGKVLKGKCLYPCMAFVKYFTFFFFLFFCSFFFLVFFFLFEFFIFLCFFLFSSFYFFLFFFSLSFFFSLILFMQCWS